MNKKILFIENNAEFISLACRLLRARGYMVHEATGPAEARQALEREYYPLLIIDIRLEDDNNELDQTGLELFREPPYADIAKIVMTSYPSFENAQRSFGYADALISKDDPSKLVQEVDKVFKEHVHFNWSLSFTRERAIPISLLQVVELIDPSLAEAQLLHRSEELLFLLMGVFREYDQVRLDRILWFRRGRVALVVHLFKKRKRPLSRILICGKRSVLLAEHEKVAKNKPTAAGHNTQPGGERFATLRFAAHSYVTLDGDLIHLRPMEERFAQATKEEAVRMVTDLCDNGIRLWQEGRASGGDAVGIGEWMHRSMLRFDPDYLDHFETNIDRFLADAQNIDSRILRAYRHAGKVCFDMGRHQLAYLDPVPILRQRNLIDIKMPFVNSPGHLYGDNVLTDEQGRCWLTCFEDAGPVPLWRDFLSIEACIRYDWSDVDFLTGHQLERQLILTPFDQGITLEGQAKTAAAIEAVRRQVKDRMADPRGWYLGMLYHAVLRTVTVGANFQLLPHEQVRMLHAILGVAMHVQTLKDGLPARTEDKTVAVPKEAVRVDVAQRSILVGDRTLKLGKKGFATFQCLYAHYGEMCPREVLGKAVWPDFQSDLPSMTRLNTEVFRLRTAFKRAGFEDPIKTHSGEGYTFSLP